MGEAPKLGTCIFHPPGKTTGVVLYRKTNHGTGIKMEKRGGKTSLRALKKLNFIRREKKEKDFPLQQNITYDQMKTFCKSQ